MITQEQIENHDKLCEEAKAKVERGEWSDEPNRFEFKHAGFQCLCLRVPFSLHWCGYVGLPPGHPLHGKSYNDLDELDAHGGLTFSGPCNEHVCHIPAPGEEEALWWFGFDCAHTGDLRPVELILRSEMPPEVANFIAISETYRDLSYVRAETEHLADQVAKLTTH